MNEKSEEERLEIRCQELSEQVKSQHFKIQEQERIVKKQEKFLLKKEEKVEDQGAKVLEEKLKLKY